MSFDASDVAVVIPTQNRWDVLERTITALRTQSATGFDIVVVVDKGAELPEFMAGVQVVHRNRRGVGAARNDGVRATDRPLIVFLGDDTIPDPGFMEHHLAMHRQYPEIEVGVLGAVHWHPEVARGRYQKWLDWSGTQFEYHTIAGDEAGWGRLYTSNVSLKRELYLKVGGFDEEFQFGYEDIELGLRLHNAGFRLLYAPSARVAHVHRYEWPAIERRFRLVGGGEYLMVRKHPDFPPYFLRKLRKRPPVTPFSPWPWVVDYVPPRFRGLRRAAEKRADSWYSKRLVAPFLAGWLAAKELEEEHLPVERYDDVASALFAEQRWLGDILPLVPRGGAILAVACSHTIGRELGAAGYRVTFATASDDLEASSTFDVALAFRIDDKQDGENLLDLAERHSALVAATFDRGTVDCERDIRRRADRNGVDLDLQDADGTALVVYRTGRPQARIDQSLLRRVRESAARLAARRLGRRRPWVPAIRG